MYMLETIAIHECENSMSKYLSLIPMTTVPCSHKDATLHGVVDENSDRRTSVITVTAI